MRVAVLRGGVIVVSVVLLLGLWSVLLELLLWRSCSDRGLLILASIKLAAGSGLVRGLRLSVVVVSC